MADSPASLRRKIGSAADLQSVVRAMKAQAAASVGQYQRSVAALGDYAHTVELGLGVCFRQDAMQAAQLPRPHASGGAAVRAIVFGSDQGLVGRFNEAVLDHARSALAALPGPTQVWAVGERLRAGMADCGIAPESVFPVPGSVHAITDLVGLLLVSVIGESGAPGTSGEPAELHLFYNRLLSGSAYAPVSQRLLPLDDDWRLALARQPWPTAMPPEVLGSHAATLRALIREYLFVSVFRACAESLASENASRLAAMERADRNIDKMLASLRESSRRLRQGKIDDELSDVVGSFKRRAGSLDGCIRRRTDVPDG